MTTLHIQPADDAAQGGSGSATDPLRIHGPEHFDELLEVLDIKCTDIKELILHHGVYFTRGAWAQPTFRVGRPFRIAGLEKNNRPSIILSRDARFETGGEARPDIVVFRLGEGFRNNHTPDKWVIENLIIDGNERAFPSDRYVVGGLGVWGHGVTIRNVQVVGLRGRRPDGPGDEKNHHESFGITVHGHPTGDDGIDGGNLIEDCVVLDNGDTNPYFSGIYPGVAYWGRPVAPSVVRNCVVRGTGSKPSSGVAFSLQENTHILDCLAVHMRYGLYNDVRPVNHCLVQRSIFKVAYCGLALRASMKFEGGIIPHKRNVMVRDCDFLFSPEDGKEWIGVWLDDAQKTGAKFENITLENCEMRLASDGPALASAGPPTPVRPFTAASLDAANMSGIRMSGRLPAGWKRHLTAQTPQNAIAFTESEREME